MKTKYKKNSLYHQMIGVLSSMSEEEIINLFDDIDNKDVATRFLKVLTEKMFGDDK